MENLTVADVAYQVKNTADAHSMVLGRFNTEVSSGPENTNLSKPALARKCRGRGSPKIKEHTNAGKLAMQLKFSPAKTF